MAVDPKVLENGGSAGKYDRAFNGTEDDFNALVSDIVAIVDKYTKKVKKAG